ncbi:MAG: hypothetical protein OXD32_05610 [Endozoicomonadaceae bacterium]|nr:hypothetical protein [Endozoicomonadaceae bacterium]MCY4329240.1 hypothetical protein [Endozoicomonadaceae bacterium]
MKKIIFNSYAVQSDINRHTIEEATYKACLASLLINTTGKFY